MTKLIAFIAVFGTIVLFHEIGHFLSGKLLGVRVYAFAIGFGPPLFRFRRGETQYSLRLIPLGGYVKFAGADRPEDGEDEIPEDDERNFTKKPIWARMAIVAAGPLMNFVLAALLLGLLAGVTPIRPQVVRVEPASPAAEAGIQPGDYIVAIGGRPTVYEGDVNAAVQASKGEPFSVTVRRNGDEFTQTVQPVWNPEEQRAMLGIQYIARQPAFGAFIAGWQRMWAVTKGTIGALVAMVRGKIAADLAGPLGIYDLVGQTARQGVVSLVWLAAVLSVNLGLLNLFPVPILDGGWLAILAVEGLRGKPLSEEQKGFLQFLGLALLLILLLFATYKDLLRIFG